MEEFKLHMEPAALVSWMIRSANVDPEKDKMTFEEWRQNCGVGLKKKAAAKTDRKSEIEEAKRRTAGFNNLIFEEVIVPMSWTEHM